VLETAKLHGHDPEAYLANVIDRMAKDHPINQLAPALVLELGIKNVDTGGRINDRNSGHVRCRDKSPRYTIRSDGNIAPRGPQTLGLLIASSI
jgi:IS66 C-terminal element